MKKVNFLLAAILFGGILINAQNNLKVNIFNIKSPNGLIEIGLFNSEKGFLKEGGQFLKKKVKVIGNSAQYTFTIFRKANIRWQFFTIKIRIINVIPTFWEFQQKVMDSQTILSLR